jgi:hypothetical protein
MIASQPSTSYAVSSSPYYGVAPIYSSGMMTTFLPQTVPAGPMTSTMPAATVSGIRPTIVPDQIMTPMVQTSQGLVPGTPGIVAPTAVPASISTQPMVAAAPTVPPASVFPTLQPNYVPVAPVNPNPTANTAPSTVQNPLPAPPTPPPSPPTQPLADPNVFVNSGQEWMDVDLTPYTRDFPDGSGAEKSVREWIVRKFDPQTWTGNQVSSLVVTPSHVKVFHNAAVQKSVCDLLVRFLYYKPGTFQSQVRVLATRDQRWQSRYQSALLPAGQSGTSSRVWLVRGEDAKAMINDLGGGNSGALLANPDAVVVNGQHLTIDWSPRAGQKADPSGTGKPTQDGVVVTFSPLIDVDAATVEMDLSTALRRTVEAKSTWGTRNDYRPDVTEANIRELVKIPPGQVVLASLGRVPSFEGSRNLFGQDKVAEILVFLACTPSPGNMVSGRPVEVAQAPAAYRNDLPTERTVSARPTESSRGTVTGGSTIDPLPREQDRFARADRRTGRPASRAGTGVPPELTMSVD